MNSTSQESFLPLSPEYRERYDLGDSAHCRFVEPEEFLQLAVSWRKLERRNDPSCGVVGLYDSATDEWFIVETEKLNEVLEARLQVE